MTLQEKWDKRLAFAVCFVFVCLFVTNLSGGFSVGGAPIYETVSVISKLAIVVVLISCLPIVVRRFNLRLLAAIVGTVVVVLAQVLFFPGLNVAFYDSLQTFMITIFPLVVCFCVMQDYGELLRQLLIASYVISSMSVLALVSQEANLFRGSYAMGFSNALVLPTCCMLLQTFNVSLIRKRRVLSLVLALLNVFMVAAYGSRGSLIAIALFFVYSIVKIPVTSRKQLTEKFILLTALMILIVGFQTILEISFELLNKLGIYSRTLNLLSTDLMHDSGRQQLWEIVWNAFMENPLAVRGINADYLLINQYSHNWFLEVLYAMGGILGGLFDIWIVVRILRTLVAKQEGYSMVQVLLLFSFFPVCLWSGSIWISMYFWPWLISGTRRSNFGRLRRS